MNKKVFEFTKIGGIEVKNRIIRSATQELMATNGRPDKRMFDLYKDLSEGGVGLIITGFFTFSSIDNPIPVTVNLNKNDITDSLQDLTDLVHSKGTKVIAQLAHLGSQIRQQTNNSIFAPSDVIDPYSNIKPKPLSINQIKLIIKEFGEAALTAKQTGFDGVQIHAAHGYLLSKFLSPVYNKRKDEYGGNPVNNSRIIIEILLEIKRVCGDDYPVWIKMNCADFGHENDSLKYEDVLITAQMLDETNIDAIELSGGTSSGKLTPARSKEFETYHLEFANDLTKHVSTDVITVGGFRTIKQIESVITETDIAGVSLCRSLIKEPNLPIRWQTDKNVESSCISCNCCFNPKGVDCIFNLNEQQRKEQQSF